MNLERHKHAVCSIPQAGSGQFGGVISLAKPQLCKVPVHLLRSAETRPMGSKNVQTQSLTDPPQPALPREIFGQEILAPRLPKQLTQFLIKAYLYFKIKVCDVVIPRIMLQWTCVRWSMMCIKESFSIKIMLRDSRLSKH